MSTDPHTKLIDCMVGTGPGTRDPDCFICTDPITASDPSVTHTKCSNTWHEACILAWDQTLEEQHENTTCPLCRGLLFARDAVVRDVVVRPFDVRDWVDAHMGFPGWDMVIAAMESHISEGVDDFEISPGYITIGMTSFIVSRANEIIPCSTFYQTLPGWHLVQENMALNGSSWFHARPDYIDTVDAVFWVGNLCEIRPEFDEYYQRLAVLPSQWQVLDSLAELRDIVDSEALNRNPDGELYSDKGHDMEWRGRNLSVQDFSTPYEVDRFDWIFYSFPGFPQFFLVRGYSSTELPFALAMRHQSIQLLEKPSDLLDLWPREYLRRNGNMTDSELEPAALLDLDLTPEAHAEFECQTKRGIVSWSLWKFRGTNLAYAIPARVTIVPAAQFLEG